MLGLDPGEAVANGADGELGRWWRVGAVEVEVVVVEAVEEAGVPAEGRHGEGDGGEGVADVVVALTEGTLAVLLGLAPEDGGDSEEKDGAAMIREEEREVEAGAELEGVVFGRVVGKERGEGEEESPSGRGDERRWASVGWRLPLLRLTRRDQVEKPMVFQADREREL